MNTLFSWYVGHREAVELYGQEPSSCSLMHLTSSTRAHILCSQSHHSSGCSLFYCIYTIHNGKAHNGILFFEREREERKRLEGWVVRKMLSMLP